ncbi:hypothetical protein [Halobacteriovorax sp. JY17]|uniref:3-phosphoshikimate 1-carboxyvinyltransferase n=1 Tax=Halobacteriovorax sp. JY17 TaxID=2014617 RepID=UPI000C474AF0|nr:hypothetical protein [Halobacteriovorax sp. JY17]PIK14044.1 MAG: hypothetical protein CES88_13755 [Halobacteriovorax sp. JY17]
MQLKNSLFNVEAEPFNKVVKVPSSKSYANRAIILASLCKESIEIVNLPLSHDVTNLIHCLRIVGLKIVDIDDGIRIENSFPECEKEGSEIIEILPGDGGTTTRFLIPFLALGKRKYRVEPEGRMRERPIADLLEGLVELGAIVNQCESWLTLNGPIVLNNRFLNIDASKTTQHATAIALALCFKGVEVSPIDMTYSTSYWEMTKNLISEFRKGQKKFIVPVDFSSMSYVLALGADLGRVRVENCFSVDKYQSDSVFIDLLRKMNFQVETKDNGLEVSTNKNLKVIDFDCSDCPDLVPTLSFICARIEGTSKLRNLSVLKYKESDRLVEIQKLLDLYQIENSYDEKNDVLLIKGRQRRVNSRKDIFPPDDHRIVMVSYLFLRANGGGSLASIESVAKSFGNFFEVVT